MNRVAARAHHGIDIAADRATEFSREVRVAYLEFLNRVKTEVAGNARPATRLTVVSLVVVGALDHEIVPDTRHATETQQSEGGIASDSRRQQGKLIIATAIQRQVLNFLLRYQTCFLGLGGLECSSTGHRYLFSYPTELQRGIHRCAGTDRNDHIGSLQNGEALLFNSDGVIS